MNSSENNAPKQTYLIFKKTNQVKIDSLRKTLAAFRKDEAEVKEEMKKNNWSAKKVEIVTWAYDQRIRSLNQQIAALRKKQKQEEKQA